MYVGGLVGYNNIGTISNSYATGSVNGTNLVGGLVGYNDTGTISNSFYDKTKYTGNGVGSDSTNLELQEKLHKRCLMEEHLKSWLGYSC